LPRFTEEVQKRVDHKHSRNVGDFREVKALLEVPHGARIAMPLDSEHFFFQRSRLLNGRRIQAIQDLHQEKKPIHLALPSDFRKKITKAFAFYPEIWEAATVHTTNDFTYDHPHCFNSRFQADPMLWIWDKDRQVSLIAWLASTEEPVLEFPHLKDSDGEPYRMIAKEGTAFVFPSHPMYAFTVLQPAIPFLLTHATHPDISRPPILTQQLQ
jgi:hypothetical protein